MLKKTEGTKKKIKWRSMRTAPKTGEWIMVLLKFPKRDVIVPSAAWNGKQWLSAGPKPKLPFQPSGWAIANAAGVLK